MFTDIYYFIYMYSIMGITLTGLFILLLEGAVCFNNFLINSHMNFLEDFEYIQELAGEDCSICLQSFDKDKKISLIKKCGHVFHDECIK
jgi:hypothetical protein